MHGRQLLDNYWLLTLLHESTAGTVAIWRYYTHESFARHCLTAMWIGGLLYKCIWSASSTQASLSHGICITEHHARQPDAFYVYDSCMLIYIYVIRWFECICRSELTAVIISIIYLTFIRLHALRKQELPQTLVCGSSVVSNERWN